MPKMKSIKKIVKRFKLTKNGKVMQRKCGQDHFNSRENGATIRNKRRDIEIGKDCATSKTLADALRR